MCFLLHPHWCLDYWGHFDLLLQHVEGQRPRGLKQSCRTTCNLSDTSDSLLLKTQQSPSFPLSTSQNTKEITLRTNYILRLLHEAKELQWSKKISPIQIYISGWLPFLCVSLSYYLAIFSINSDGSLRRLYAARPKAAEKRFVLQPV